MIILIGGSSHVGKTYISQKLLEKYHYPYISLDHLKMGFIRTKMTELTVEDDLQMSYFLWPYAAEIIKTAIENNQNLIVEGCYIPKEWKASFEAEYLKDIRCMFIVMSESYIRKKWDDIIGYANVVEKRLDDDTDMESIIICNREFKKDCIENGTAFFEIDSKYDAEGIIRKIDGLI